MNTDESIIGPNWVRTTEFEVRRTDRETVVYTCGPRSIDLYCEAGWDPEHFVAVYVSNVTAWNDGTELPPTEKAALQEHLLTAFGMLGTRIKLE